MFASLQSAFLSSASIWINTVVFSLIIAVCYSGDKLLSIQNRYYRAACDNSTHALIGGLCWAVVEGDLLLRTWKSWMHCIVCVFLAMSVDFDHFIAAGTLNIELCSIIWHLDFLDLRRTRARGILVEQFSLKHPRERASHSQSPTRPIFHNTSLILMIVLLCWLLRRQMDGLTTLALMILTSCLSHHLRDANRRGLWFFPFGSTPPLSFPVYVASTIVLSLFVRFVQYIHISSENGDKSIDSLLA